LLSNCRFWSSPGASTPETAKTGHAQDKYPNIPKPSIQNLDSMKSKAFSMDGSESRNDPASDFLSRACGPDLSVFRRSSPELAMVKSQTGSIVV
jgi:hypothetical protein